VRKEEFAIISLSRRSHNIREINEHRPGHCIPRWLRPLNSVHIALRKVHYGKHRHALEEGARWEDIPCMLIRMCRAPCMPSPPSASIQWGSSRLYCSFFAFSGFMWGQSSAVAEPPATHRRPPPAKFGNRLN